MEIVGWLLTAAAVLCATKLLALGLILGGFWLKKRACAMTPEKWDAWFSSLDPARVLGWLSLGYGAALLACGGLAYLVLRALALPWAGQATLFALACCALGFALRLCRNHQDLMEKLRRVQRRPEAGEVSGRERK